MATHPYNEAWFGRDVVGFFFLWLQCIGVLMRECYGGP
jgi:hypothetical protein